MKTLEENRPSEDSFATAEFPYPLAYMPRIQ